MKDVSFLIEDFVYDIPAKWLWLIFLIVVILISILSYILNYHWKFLGTKQVKKGRRLYFSVLAILFLIAVGSLISFQIYK
jgi:hypothetical protein